MNHNDVITLLVSLASGLEVSSIAFLVWVVKKIGQHDVALALLIQQVNPPGDKSLRTILNEIQLQQAEARATAEGINRGH